MTAFHDAFARALLAPEVPRDGPLREILAQPAFAVYRNTVMKGCIDALEANFPAAARLVGIDWFRSAAAEFVRQHPPVDARLLVYGDDRFPDFLEDLPSAAGLPWLADVARLDTLWRAVHAAADAPVLDAAALFGRSAEALAACVLRPHPARRWAWFEHHPAASLWSHARFGAGDIDPPAWQGEGLLLVRAAGAVQWQLISRGACALLDACARHQPLGVAADQALHADPATDLGAVLALLLQAGAFTDFHSFTGDPS